MYTYGACFSHQQLILLYFKSWSHRVLTSLNYEASRLLYVTPVCGLSRHFERLCNVSLSVSLFLPCPSLFLYASSFFSLLSLSLLLFFSLSLLFLSFYLSLSPNLSPLITCSLCAPPPPHVYTHLVVPFFTSNFI